MNNKLHAIWQEEDGVLSFEWVLLVTLLTIGIISGLAGARDAIIDELADISEAALNFDQSYTIAEFTTALITAGGFSYTDDTAAFTSCDRTAGPLGQGAADDSVDGS